MRKYKILIIIKIIFFIWLVLANTLLIGDVASYYHILSDEDAIVLINRNINVVFVHIFFGIPHIIALIILAKLFINRDFK